MVEAAIGKKIKGSIIMQCCVKFLEVISCFFQRIKSTDSKELKLTAFSMLSADCDYAKREHEDEGEHAFRDKFSRDRDRVLYSKAFRRLSGKTQVFVTSFDDHARTRLTHTIEVSQIAKTIANRLGLNEVLTEAIALGHDIGHTPFGHVGERTLNNIMNGCIKIKDINSHLQDSDRGFKHNWQGVRVVRDLEDKDRRWKGLNLTDYTLWGILNHSKTAFGACKKSYGSEPKYCGLNHKVGQECDPNIGLGFYQSYYDVSFGQSSWSFEAFIVEIADEISQRHHDIEDGIEAKIVDRDSLVNVLSSTFKPWLEEYQESFDELSGETRKEYYLPKFSKFIINLLVSELLSNCQEKLAALISDFGIEDKDGFNELKNQNNSEFIKRACEAISYREDFKTAEKVFHSYLKSKVLNSYHAQSMDGRSQYIIKQLFKAYVTNPQQLPDSTIEKICKRIIPELERSGASESSDYRRVVEELHYNIKDDEYRAYRVALLRTIADYISGMTDNFAISQYQRLYGHAGGFQ